MRGMVVASAVALTMVLAGCLSDVEEAVSVLSGEEDAYLTELDRITADHEAHRQKLMDSESAYTYGGATKGETLQAFEEVREAWEQDTEALAALTPPVAWGKSHYHLVQAYDANVRALEADMDCIRYDDPYACDQAIALIEIGNEHMDRSVELAPY